MLPKPKILMFIFFLSMAAAYAQDHVTKDISAVYAEGKVNGNEYKNDYFGLTLRAEGGRFTGGGFVSSDGKRARLVDMQANPDAWKDKFEIAVLADSLAANPTIHSPEQYVRSARHQFEKEGMETEKVESPAEVSGLSFVRAVLKINDGGRIHYRAVYSTFLKGYILSLDLSAATPEKIEQLAASAIQFKSQIK